MILAIASGKGGTGKTTVAVNLAYALERRGENVRLLDCDVEEPNDHLFVRPDFIAETAVMVKKPVCNAQLCNGCGKCAEACNYNAIAALEKGIIIFNELCHSCGVCSFVCPNTALSECDKQIGIVRQAPATENRTIFFADGLLNIGEALAPNVVRSVKKHIDPGAINIIDAAPGTACPVVAAIASADAVLLVTEPTPFGLNDLDLAVKLTLKMGIPTGIIINRSDGRDEIIAEYAEKNGVPIAGRIPFRREYAQAYSRGSILVHEFPELRVNLLNIFDNLSTASPPQPPHQCLVPSAAHVLESLHRGKANDFKEVTIISGKGGTGKTTLTACLAQFADNAVLADNDVDAADLHLLLSPKVLETHEFSGGIKAEISAENCIGCGRCAAACHFDAIRLDGPANDIIGFTYRIESLLCEGCGLCTMVCPTNAISKTRNIAGYWHVSTTDNGPMVHARLGIAEENSGRLIAKVRDRAAQLAAELKHSLILGDGPPGTGCPVIASVTGTNLALIVTEPTVSGVHDLERVLKLTGHFKVKAAVVINKADLNDEQARRIEELTHAHGALTIGQIPFDRMVNTALMIGKTITDYAPDSAAGIAVQHIWNRLKQMLLCPEQTENP